MGDISKGLPIRTEDDPDQYTRVRVYDESDATRGQTVDADKNAHVEVHGNRCDDAADVALLLSEQGRSNPRGDYEADDNSCPATAGPIMHVRATVPADSDLTFRPTGIQGTDLDTVHAQDVAMHDENGDKYSITNPLPVAVTGDTSGTEVHDFDEAVDLAALGTANHDLSVADATTFLLEQIIFDASSRAKAELQLGDGGAVEVFATKAVWFIKEDSSAIHLPLSRPIKAIGTVNTTTVRLIKENTDDDDAQSIYSTLVGVTL